MKQHEAVIKTMRQNGGFATLGYLNQEVFESVRRGVENENAFCEYSPDCPRREIFLQDKAGALGAAFR